MSADQHLDALLARLTALAPEEVRHSLQPIPWPPGLAPVHVPIDQVDGPLPEAQVILVTWTAAEVQALADVLSPGHPHDSWATYAENFANFETRLTWKSPAREAKRLGEYALITIGAKRVLLFHSQLHLATDDASAPVIDLWKQILGEAKPELVITTGTAGGIGQATGLGDVFVCNSAKFNCTKRFATMPWAQQRFSNPCTISGPNQRTALIDLVQINARQLPADLLPPQRFVGGIPVTILITDNTGDVETVDYFAFDDTDDSFGVRADDGAAQTEEMDDATLPLALSELGATTRWLSVRNASDPEVPSSVGDIEAQRKWAASIYQRYGYLTTVGSAVACWSLIADL